MPELFFCRDLEGYGWCVRKGEYLNIGLGRRDHGDLNPHIDDFIAFLERRGLARARLARAVARARVSGVRHRPRPLIGDGVLVAGDAAGLAYPESGEGIKPAVESGRLAAETLIAAGGRVGTRGPATVREWSCGAATRRRARTPDAFARRDQSPRTGAAALAPCSPGTSSSIAGSCGPPEGGHYVIDALTDDD